MPRTSSRLRGFRPLLLALPVALACLAAEPGDQPVPGLSLPPLSSLLAPTAPPQLPPWAASQRGPLTFTGQAEGFWGSVSGKQVLPAPSASAWDDPATKPTWQTEQTWKCDLAGPLSLFGQFGETSQEATRKDTTLTGQTGLTCKIPVALGAQVQLRGGPSVTCADPARPDLMQAQSQMLLEVTGGVPLVWGVGLEVQAKKAAGLTPLDKDSLQQEVRLAFPVGTAGKLNLGARRSWEGLPEQQQHPTPATTQVFLGLELKH